MRSHVFVLSFVISLLLSMNAAAQDSNDSWKCGLFSGAKFSVNQTNIIIPKNGDGYFGFESGTATDGTFGVIVERYLTSWPTLGEKDTGFVVHRVYVLATLKVQYDPLHFDFVSIVANNVLRDSVRRSGNLLASLSYLNVTLDIKQSFGSSPAPNGFYVAAGPTIGILTSDRITETISKTPTSTNTTSTSTYNYPISDAKAFRFGINIEVGYDLPVSDKLIASLMAGYDAPLSKLSEQYDWNVKYAYLSASFKYSIH